MESIHCDIPTSFEDNEFGVTSSCIAICVMHPIDGEVEIVLTNECTASLTQASFEGRVSTPTRSLSLFSTELKELLSIPVEADTSKVTVYFPGSTNRDKAVIVVSK